MANAFAVYDYKILYVDDGTMPWHKQNETRENERENEMKWDAVKWFGSEKCKMEVKHSFDGDSNFEVKNMFVIHRVCIECFSAQQPIDWLYG